MFPWTVVELFREIFNNNQQNKLLNRRLWKMCPGSLGSRPGRSAAVVTLHLSPANLTFSHLMFPEA